MTNPYIIVPLALLFAPVLGAILMGIDRKVTARIQGRIGPPLFQPFYDVIKLLQKDKIAVNRFQILYAFLHLGFMLVVVVMIAMQQDMLMILFAHAFSTMALIMGGMCVRSPYSRIGSHRKILQMIAYEPILVLMVVGIYLASPNHSFMIGELSAGSPMLFALPLVFLAIQMAIAIKLQKSPFDTASSHHAHQEIVKGITIEYSGPFLAILEITDFYEVATLFAVIVLFCWPYTLVGVGVAMLCFSFQIILDNSFARLSPMWMLKYMWTVPTLAALSNVIWLYYR